MKYPQKYGRQGNSMTYGSNSVMLYIPGTQLTDGQKDAFSLSPRRVALPKNYQGITLTFIMAKIYNALLCNCIEPKIEKILGKNQNGFWLVGWV